MNFHRPNCSAVKQPKSFKAFAVSLPSTGFPALGVGLQLGKTLKSMLNFKITSHSDQLGTGCLTVLSTTTQRLVSLKAD